MTDTVTHAAPLIRWQGDRGTYHLVSIDAEAAEQIAMHERLLRLEYGSRRGFGSVKVMARIGQTEWKSSVFPQRQSRPLGSAATGEQERTWILLVSKKVMRAEGLEAGELVKLELGLL